MVHSLNILRNRGQQHTKSVDTGCVSVTGKFFNEEMLLFSNYFSMFTFEPYGKLAILGVQYKSSKF